VNSVYYTYAQAAGDWQLRLGCIKSLSADYDDSRQFWSGSLSGDFDWVARPCSTERGLGERGSRRGFLSAGRFVPRRDKRGAAKAIGGESDITDKVRRASIVRIRPWNPVGPRSSSTKLAALRPKEGISMLILTRKSLEEIIIDDRIRISILKIDGNRVKIGIEAPSDVAIRRHELHDNRIDGNTPLPFVLQR
jgi:carbon storage regulator CsrA